MRDRHQLDSLIRAAVDCEDHLAEALSSIGPERAAGLLVDELVSRADVEDVVGRSAPPAVVAFLLEFDGHRVEHEVRADGGRVDHGPLEPGRRPDATVELSLTGLARAVFGAVGDPTDVHRRLRWPDLDDPGTVARAMLTVPLVRRLVRGLENRPVDLAEVLLRNGSDKWGPLHAYAPHYERHFGPLRDRALTVVELGIGGYDDPEAGGGSLRAWKRFFPRAMIYGVDVVDKSGIREQRVHTVQGDQADPEFLDDLVAEVGPPDIVIDDGSHVPHDVLTTFHALFPHLAPGGLYAVEDVQTSYWPGYGGSTDHDDPHTTAGFLKGLVDGLHHQEFEPRTARAARATDSTVTALHVYHNLAFIRRGLNDEDSVPGWIGRSPHTGKAVRR